MPNLSYLDADEAESATADPPRCMSAVPDLFHDSFSDDGAVNYVNLSSFLKNQDEIYQSLLAKLPANTKAKSEMVPTIENSPESQALTSTLKEVTETETLTKAPAHYSTVNSMELMSGPECRIGASCQSSPCDIEMELLVLPMVDDFSKVELRIPSASLSAEKKRVLKRIAAENELTILNFGKGGTKYTVVRKKTALLQKQAAQREAELEAERQRQQLLEEARLAADSQVTSDSAICVASIQTTPSETQLMPSESSVKSNRATERRNNKRRKEIVSCNTEVSMNSAARRKARRAAEREEARKAEAALRKRERRRRETAIQTCPPNWIICPWCKQDIPPAEQCGHIGLCRAAYHQRNREAKAQAQLQNYRIATENARRRKQNLPLLNPVQQVKRTQMVEWERNHGKSASRRQPSHSRTRSVDGGISATLKKQAVIAAQLKEVHPNDVNGMLHATQRVCALSNCAHLITSSAGGPCAYCRLNLCAQHRPPHIGHYCPTAPQARAKKALSNGQIEVACGIEAAERQAALKQRMREKLNVMVEKRRR
ncbi:unnamed protein product [Hydatigera taeniaeformis]|uniref:AN1-type domain-containing protein n=1 Tax=Hydatigena taeniaeformis TaxID=6205 RepID=A0A158RDN0_HYDTA|nr:unnamed protein product [Hydatigera taeniaeformis]